MAEIKALGLWVLVGIGDDIEPPRPAVFETHRHHHTGRVSRGKGVSLAIARLDLGFRNSGSAELIDQPVGVVALRKPDRRRDVAKVFVLFQQPGAFEIPPLHAVEEIIETGAVERKDRFLRRAEVFGAEHHLGIGFLRVADQAAPDFGRHLIGRVATKTAKAQTDVMPHQLLEIAKDLTPLRGPIIEFGEIAPYRLLRGVGRIGREGRNDIAARITGEPVGIADDELAVLGGMVDDQIHDDAQPVRARRLGKGAQKIVVVARLAAAKPRIEQVIVLHRVEAPRKTRVMERVHIDGIEPHRRDPRQMRRPFPGGAGQCRKEIVYAEPFAHCDRPELSGLPPIPAILS